MSYDTVFYDAIRAGCQASAGAVAPLVVQLLHPRTVIDIGCGEGWWAQAFAELGCDVRGLDGEYVDASPLGERFAVADLEQPLPIGDYDLAVCLEVAEHLSEARAAGLVADLCRLAPAVLFSAAIPGQTGLGHINCQWPGYWSLLFEVNGFRCTGALRWAFWNDERVEPWYRQNLLLAVSGDLPAGLLHDEPPRSVVHPVIYGWALG